MILHQDRFSCQNAACGIHGDIFDAAGIFINSDDKRKQYEEVVSVLGGVMPDSLSHVKKSDFTPVDNAVKAVADFMRKHKDREAGVREYLKKRGYAPEIIDKMQKYFGWWPGFEKAIKKLDRTLLKQAGIPLVHPKVGKSSWHELGVVLRLGSGFKVFFYDSEGKSQKIGSKSCRSFPVPAKLPQNGTLILAEGEMNAISAHAVEIPIFATGGTNALTKELIEKYIINSQIEEIIFAFDGDIPGERGREKVAELLINCGYDRLIRFADLPAGKDPDDLIRENRIDDLKKAIEEAKPYHKEAPWSDITEEQNPEGLNKLAPASSLSVKRVQSLLKKIPRMSMIEKDAQLLIASFLRYAENDAEIVTELTAWNETEKLPEGAVTQADSGMITLAIFLDLLFGRVSNYLYNATKKELIPPEEKLKTVEIARCDIQIDMESLRDELCITEFLTTEGNHSAAQILGFALSDKVIYVENEKKYYAFNGHHWHREPDMVAIVYQVLNNVLHAIKSSVEDPEQVWKCMLKIQSRKFRTDVLTDFSGIDGVFYESVQWDGSKIAETLTLADGVMDFSSDKIVYRHSLPKEFRKEYLPYKIDDIRKSSDPEFFMQFMKGNFKDEKTLLTLMFYASLIASRYTGYKYGGIFVGPPNTGKTTTIEVLSKVYPGMIDKIPSELLMPDNRRLTKSGNEASPYLARLEGRGAAIAQESKKGAYLNGAFWKELTGGDTMTARPLYGQPKDFQPTAQIILTTNYAPHFDAHDAAVIARMVIVPFKEQHTKNDGTSLSQKEIMDRTTAEAPGIIKMFASYYIVLKTQHNGEIPLSKECQAYKDQYIQGEETDLSRFIDEYCIIDLSDDPQNYTPVQDLYEKFVQYVEFDEKEKPTRNKFVRWMKRDFMEIKYEQKRSGQMVLKIFRNVRLKDSNLKLNLEEEDDDTPF